MTATACFAAYSDGLVGVRAPPRLDPGAIAVDRGQTGAARLLEGVEHRLGGDIGGRINRRAAPCHPGIPRQISAEQPAPRKAPASLPPGCAKTARGHGDVFRSVRFRIAPRTEFPGEYDERGRRSHRITTATGKLEVGTRGRGRWFRLVRQAPLQISSVTATKRCVAQLSSSLHVFILIMTAPLHSR